MKKIYLAVILSVIILPLTSCLESLLPVRGNGIIVTESRRSGPFNQIENSTSVDVVYKQADSTSITIKADENLLEYIVTETFNNTLEIKTKPGHNFLDFKERPLISITAPDLEKIDLAGSGTFVADEMSGDAVILKLSGSGDISVDQIECSLLSVTVSGSGNIIIESCLTTGSELSLTGSGNINIKGQSEECQYKITGSGGIFADQYLISSASVIIIGSGNIFANIETDLTARITGSGNIYLKGDPTISQTITGSGRIIRYK